MKKIFTIASLFSFMFLFAQNEVAKKIQELEKQRTNFKPFSILDVAPTPQYNFDKVVENATIATIKNNVVNDIVANKYQFVELTLPYNGKLVTLDMYQVNLFAEGFHVDTDKSKNIAYEKGVYYRGIVKGDYHSIASFNFFNNELNGVVSNDELTNLIIGKLGKEGNNSDYIVYSDANFKISNDFICSFKDDESQPAPPVNQTNRDITSNRCVTMYFEVDYNLFQSNSSSTTTTTNWLTSVFNNVQALYNADGITVSLKSMYLWTTPDPYDGVGTSSTDYLYKFNEVRPVFDGDVGQLIGIDPGGLGGLAVGINGLCSQDNFCYADVNFTYVSGNLPAIPTYSWTIEVMTHELGHLLGSPHTHACVWNGNNTAIDNCASSAQGSSAEGYSCRTTPLTIPSTTVKGTIMSYCHLVNNVGIKFSNGFGPQPAARVLSRVNAATCLSTDCVNTCINTISSIAITNVSATTAVVTWVDSGSFATWNVRVYPFGTTAGAWITVTSNSYSVSGLTSNTYYVVDVSPSCTAGLQIGGRQLIFVTADDFCNGLVYADSGGVAGDYTNQETVVRTIIPNVPNNAIVLTFSEFSLEQDYDYLYVYDGNTTAANDLSGGGFTGTVLPGPFTSSAADGSLTVKFYSDQGVVDTGFVANISCTPNLSVNHYNGYVDFSYYPNPTNGKVMIASKIPMSQVLVYNVTGQLLYNNTINDLNTNVDISSFAVGTYFFKLKFDGDKEVNFKVMRK